MTNQEQIAGTKKWMPTLETGGCFVGLCGGDGAIAIESNVLRDIAQESDVSLYQKMF